MAKRMGLILLLFVNIFNYNAQAETDTCWAVTVLDNPSPGYYKLGWNGNYGFSLLDNYGTNRYEIRNDYLSMTLNQKLLKNGYWLSYGTQKSILYLCDRNLKLVDSIPVYSNENYCLNNHDADVLTNGHYLLLYEKYKTMDMSKIVDGGSENAKVTDVEIVETDRNGTIYWVWNALDHFSVTDATSDIDLTQETIDFAHANSVCEDTDGNLVLSFRNLDEIVKINKKTGDIMWRFGGENCKNNQFTFLNDEVNGYTGFSHQHSVTLLPNGNILMFDNGTLKSPQYSRVVEYQPDFENMTALKVWEHRNAPDLYTDIFGSAQRLPNGNTLINWVSTKVEEVRPDHSVAFQYQFRCGELAEGAIYRACKYVTLMDAVTLPISSPGTYHFNNEQFNTAATLVVTNLSGSGAVSLEKHNYGPPFAQYQDSGFTAIFPYRWVLSDTGITNIQGTVKIKASAVENLLHPRKVQIFKRDSEATGTFKGLNSTYNAATGEITAEFTGSGEFALSYNELTTPEIISPANKATGIAINGSFQWKATHGATHYQLQLSSLPDFSVLITNAVVDSGNTLNYKALEYQKVYYWRIRAMSKYDTTAWTGNYSFTTLIVPAPDSLRPVSGTTGFKPGSSLSWKAVDGAGYYRVRVSLDNNFTNLVLDSNKLAGNSISIEKVQNNTVYYWQVKAYQGTAEGPFSAVNNFTTTLPAPVLSCPADDSTGLPLKGRLSWNPVAGAFSYRLEISGYGDFRELKYGTNIAGDTSFGYNDFEPATEYFWRVKACRQIDTSAWSSVFSFSTLLAGPVLKAPANNAKEVGTEAKLTWIPYSTALGYRLQIAADSSFSIIITDTNGLKNAYFNCSLPSTTKLHWRVKADYPDGPGEWSEAWSFTTATAALLPAPELLLPENNTVADVGCTVSWRALAKAAVYYLQIAGNRDFSRPVVSDSSITKTEYSFVAGEYNEKYFWRVKAGNTFDWGNWSDVRSFTIQAPHVTLADPLNENVQTQTAGVLKWFKYINADGYRVQLCRDTLFSYNVLDVDGLKDTVAEYSGLQYNTEYFWRVQYKKGGVPGQWSFVHSFITHSEYGLSAPELKSPEDGSYAIPVEGSLQWNSVTGAETYRAGISKSPVFDEFIVRQSGITDTKFNYSGLEYNRVYYWRITAFNSTASSHWSQVRSFHTELQIPQQDFPPDNATGLPAEGTLSWFAVQGAGTYHLQIAADKGFNSVIHDEAQLADTSFTYGLTPSLTFYWRVKADSSLNCSSWSETRSFTLADPSGVPDGSRNDAIAIYPNPVSGHLLLSGVTGSSLSYSVYTVEGVEVMGGVAAGNTIDVSSLAPGCYFLKLNEVILGFIKME